MPIVIGILFAAGLFLGLPLFWIMSVNLRLRQAESDAVKERQAAQTSHIPLTGADLRRNPPLADADNAAPFYRQMSQSFQGKSQQLYTLEKQAEDSLKMGNSQAYLAAARSAVALCQPEFALMEQAAQKPACDFKRDWSLGADVVFPEFADMRRMVRLLSLKADVFDCDGKPSEALQQLEIGGKMVQHLQSEPFVIGMLVDIALEAILDRRWHILVSHHANDAAFLDRAEQVSRNLGKVPDLKHALRGEVVIGLASIEKMKAGKFREEDYAMEGQPSEIHPRYAPLYEKNMIAMYRKAFAAIDAAKGDNLQIAQAMEKIWQEEEEAYRKDRAGHALNQWVGVISGNLGKQLLKVQTWQQMRLLKIELLKYRLAHGAFPKDLSSFDAKLTVDPYNRQPLHCRVEGDGYRLWSVGDNGADDGGKLEPNGTSKLDIVTTFPEPKIVPTTPNFGMLRPMQNTRAAD